MARTKQPCAQHGRAENGNPHAGGRGGTETGDMMVMLFTCPARYAHACRPTAAHLMILPHPENQTSFSTRAHPTSRQARHAWVWTNGRVLSHTPCGCSPGQLAHLLLISCLLSSAPKPAQLHHGSPPAHRRPRPPLPARR
jgi:hypothetical protein